MLRRLEDLTRAVRRQDEDKEADSTGGFGPLRLLTAQLLLVTAAEAVLKAVEFRDPEPRPDRFRGTGRGATAAKLAPGVIAPLAAAAHLMHLSNPSRAVDVATRVLDTAVVGVGVGAALAGLVSRRSGAARSTAPLALATAGVLGLVIDRQERAHEIEHRRLARRASVVEKLVPARRPKVDHIVVHV